MTKRSVRYPDCAESGCCGCSRCVTTTRRKIGAPRYKYGAAPGDPVHAQRLALAEAKRARKRAKP